MLEVCTEECISPKQVSFISLFMAVALNIMGYPKKRVEDINFLCVKENAHENSRVYFE